ncbi:NTP transferase domain-containing protein [Eubacteriales bacterium OttesenSCG-928-M02]|nr:NTP transferase domain-containing protein [Eubacteriales bacterium OttesenSCG-928-M02]
MKAVIMAGGEGTRLRPLTCDLPKPMVPFFGRPVMEYQVALLEEAGIEEVGVTLAYLPDDIKEYFDNETGYHLTYGVEQTPLGTAGSVKNLGQWLDAPFVVISGDAVMDIDLTEAISYHKERGAEVTIVLKQVQVPVEYGVVVTDEGGRVTRFLEKPDWNEVFSDLVNTGIYIIEPGVMDRVPAGESYDFSKDLFPQLLADGVPLYGYETKGYWCDIGDIGQYAAAHWDVLDGKCRLPFLKEGHEEIAPGAQVAKSATLLPPYVIGDKVVIGENAVVGPYAVLDRGSFVGHDAKVSRSILWERASIGHHGEVKGAILCDGTEMASHARAFAGSVVGKGSRIGPAATVGPNISIWPEKRIPTRTTVKEDVVWGQGTGVYEVGIGGTLLEDITPWQAAQLGAALSQGYDSGVVGYSGAAAGAAIRLGLLSGLSGGGMRVTDLLQVSLPVLRHHMMAEGLSIGMYVEENGEYCRITLLDGTGKEFSTNQLRRVRSDMQKHSPLFGEKATYVRVHPYGESDYMGYIARRFASRRPARMITAGSGEEPMRMALKRCGHSVLGTRETLKEMQEGIRTFGADFGVMADGACREILVMDETGRMLENREVDALRIFASAGANDGLKAPVPVPSTGLVEYAKRIQADIGEEGDRDIYESAIGFACALARALVRRRMNISQALMELPAGVEKEAELVLLPTEIGRVMKRFGSDPMVEQMDRGMYYKTETGYASILPDIGLPGVIIKAGADRAEVAEELTAGLMARIQKLMAEEDALE